MRRVIVVDDDAAIRRLVSDALKDDLDVEVECLNDGYDAIQRLGQRTPDLLLLDVIMPGVDGLAVLRWLRQHPPAQPMVVIGFTAAGLPTAEQLRACGAADVIAKPFDVSSLLDIVRRHLSQSPAASRRSA